MKNMENTKKIENLQFGIQFRVLSFVLYAIKQELFAILLHLLDKLLKMIIKLYLT